MGEWAGPLLPSSIPTFTPFPQPVQALPAGELLPPHPRAWPHLNPTDTSGPLVQPLWEGLKMRTGWEEGCPGGSEYTPGPFLPWLGKHRILGENKATSIISNAGEHVGKRALWKSAARG